MGQTKVIGVDYHDGLRFPHIERVDGTPDRLDDILKPDDGGAEELVCCF